MGGESGKGTSEQSQLTHPYTSEQSAHSWPWWGGPGPSRPFRRNNIVCKAGFFVFESKILAFLLGSH